MANVAHLQDKNGNTYDIAACEFNGARNVKFTGDVTNGTGTSWSGAGELQTALTIENGAVTTAKINDSAVDSNKIADDAVTLAKIADGAMSGSVGDNTDNLATHKQVKTYVDNAISGQGHYLGKKTVAQINALTGVNNGDRVGVTDSGTITDGGISVRAGEDLIYFKNGDVHHWDSMDGDFVIKNNAITGATKCKVTYDSKGLVTGGADLAASDIPTLAISKIDGLQTALDGKASSTHSHAISDVTGLQSALDSKQATLPTTGTASATYAINVSGSAGSATSAGSVPWSGVTGKPTDLGTYTCSIPNGSTLLGSITTSSNYAQVALDVTSNKYINGNATRIFAQVSCSGSNLAARQTVYSDTNYSLYYVQTAITGGYRIDVYCHLIDGIKTGLAACCVYRVNVAVGTWTHSGTAINPIPSGLTAFSSADLKGNASTATTATNATKATQDASGNVITTYYAAKTELAIALTEIEINNAWKEVFG